MTSRVVPTFLAVLNFVLLPLAWAQTNITYSPQIPTAGVGHDYIRLLDETVNPADGNLSVRINLPVSEGRGFTIPFSVAYSSSMFGAMNGNSQVDFLSAGGWSYTFPLLSYVEGKTLVGTVLQGGQNVPQYCYYNSNFMFHAPGTGSGHSLVLSPWGQYASPYNGKECSGAPSLLGGDGMFQAAMASNLCCNNPSTITVADPDGTIYYFAGPITWGGGKANELVGMPNYIEDRNGNRVTLQNSYSNCCVYTGGASIADDMGRTLISTNGFGTTGNTISVSGLSSPYSLTWGGGGSQLISVYAVSQNTANYPSCPQQGVGAWQTEPPLGGGVSSITLPNGQSYQFSYDPTYGLLSKITYPSGGYVKYIWGLNKQSSSFEQVIPPTGQINYTQYCVYSVDQPGIVERDVSFDGQTIALTQSFAYSTTWASPQIGRIATETTTVTTTDNVVGLSYATVYTYNATSGGTPPNDPSPQPSGFALFYPSEEQTIQYYKDTNTKGTPLRTVTKGWGANPYDLVCEVDTLDNGQISGVFNVYSTAALPVLTDKKEYDYGLLSASSLCSNNASAPSGVVPTRETAISYQTFAAQPLFSQPFSSSPILTLLDRPTSVITYGDIGGNSAEVAETDYAYDKTGTSPVSAIDHDETNYSSTSPAPRGNATTKTAWCFQGCSNSVTAYSYDETGHVTSVTDPNGNKTSYSYSDSWLSTNSGDYTTTAGSPPGNTNAYLTHVTYPLTGGVSHAETFSYGYNDGQLTQSNDQNLQKTTYSYNDTWSRPTGVSYPDGGQVTEAYNDSPYSSTTPSPSVTTTKAITSSTNLITLAAADGLNHPVQSQLNSDPDGTDFTFTTYDGLGRKHTLTNPYRSTSDSTYGTTTYTYDPLGRIVLVKEPDGSTIQTSYCGPSTLVVDEAGHWRRSTSDGLGRLVEVDEPNSATASVSACPQSGDPIIATTYYYDVLNNLIGVLQNGSRQRTFVYDSLSRLLASFNPESNSGTGTVTVPAQVATGSITISWNGCTSNCSGDKVFVYVNGTGTGHLCFTGFTPGETAPAVALATASVINSDSVCSQYVAARASGATVYLTSNVSGPSGEYSYSSSTNGSSYTATASGSTLTLGTAYTMPSGSTTYTYDSNRNLLSKTEPAQNQTGSATVTVSYCYDALNRMTSKAYSAQSCPQTAPVVTYSYDSAACLGQGSCYNVGRRTGMLDSAGSESWSYDKMGRVLTDQRTTNSVTKSTIYTYSPYVDGSLYTLQYPSGRTVTYNTGPAERLLSVTDTASSVYYATGAHYAPQGALAALTNNDNIASTDLYNKRLQPCWTYVTTGTALATNTPCTAADTTPGNILDLQFIFNLGNGTTGTDNGNVMGIANNRDTTRSQMFTYDWLNRILIGETTSTASTSSAHCWSQQFGYDVWANLLTTQPASSAYNGCTQPSNLTVSVSPQNQISGFTYDAAGNLMTIPGTGGASYTYDADNHMTSTAGVTYVYDGDGQRVEKLGSKLYWYGTGGEVLDETDQTGSTTNSDFSEYIYFGGKRIGRRDSVGDVFYYFADHLGTSRTMAQVLSGQTTAGLCYDADFYPFGGERTYTNTCPQNYKYTAKERDTESGLDNFGARYSASSLGRFMSPDALKGSATNPQNWNRYTYALNRPLIGIDPSGYLTIIIGGTFNGNPAYAQSGTPFNTAVSQYFHESPDRTVVFPWSGSLFGKKKAAKQLAEFINQNLKAGEPLNIVAHSHGGNVAKLYTQMAGAEFVDVLMTLGTPNRPDIKANKSDVGEYINVYSMNDSVQGIGGPWWCFFCSWAKSNQADYNVEVSSDSRTDAVWHSDLHTPEVLDRLPTVPSSVSRINGVDEEVSESAQTMCTLTEGGNTSACGIAGGQR